MGQQGDRLVSAIWTSETFTGQDILDLLPVSAGIANALSKDSLQVEVTYESFDPDAGTAAATYDLRAKIQKQNGLSWDTIATQNVVANGSQLATKRVLLLTPNREDWPGYDNEEDLSVDFIEDTATGQVEQTRLTLTEGTCPAVWRLSIEGTGVTAVHPVAVIISANYTMFDASEGFP